MIRLRVTRAGGGARSTSARYYPFIWCQDSCWRGGSNPSNRSTSSPSSSILHLWSPFRLALMERPSLRMSYRSLAGYWSKETLSSTSLHVATKIHAFFQASLALGFATALRRPVKVPYSLVGVVGGRRGSRLLLPRYSDCSLRGAPQWHLRTK